MPNSHCQCCYRYRATRRRGGVGTNIRRQLVNLYFYPPTPLLGAISFLISNQDSEVGTCYMERVPVLGLVVQPKLDCFSVRATLGSCGKTTRVKLQRQKLKNYLGTSEIPANFMSSVLNPSLVNNYKRVGMICLNSVRLMTDD